MSDPAGGASDWLSVGDSIAGGYVRFGGLSGEYGSDPTVLDASTAAGRSPQQVLDYIRANQGRFKNQQVLLSSGVSNDPSQIHLVPQQIKALQDAGASQIQLAGVGSRAGTEAGQQFDLRQHNPILQQYAQDAGIGWGGPLPAVVHPARSWYSGPGALSADYGGGSDAGTVTASAPAPGYGSGIFAPVARPAPAGNQLASPAGQYTPTQAADLVGHYESEGLARRLGIDPYYIGVGGTDLSKAQPRPGYNGFPSWEGHGTSHAAGRYQFQPDTWRQYAEPLGINDFSRASQDAVFRAAYLDKGFGHWAPYNTALASHIGQAVPAEWAAGQQARVPNPLVPQAGAAPRPAPDQSWLDSLPPAQELPGARWSRLLELSAFAQGARLQPVQVKYDPRRGTVAQPEPMQPTRLMAPGLGQLPAQTEVPRTQLPQPTLPVGDPSARQIPLSRSPQTMLQPTQYVTRLGMRPYYLQSA